MSPASSSAKSKDKKSARVHGNGGITSNGYNPLSGTFHTFESLPVSAPSSPNVNGRFRNIDDVDDHNGSSLGDGVECDTISNNGSWSGKSDDHKEKPFQPSNQEHVPGAADTEKREKMRLKNERKHQRQKERRAQELHERCSGYLMSRKLEALAQQLVAMGFSSERAIMALILNEGRVEESVSWLFDGGVEEKNSSEHNLVDSGENLKIDISEELAKITDMEIKYKASKQEVERAIVSCEGDIEKAEEMLSAAAPKQQEYAATTTAYPKSPEETPPVAAEGSRLTTSVVLRPQSKALLLPTAGIQQKRDEKDFNYTKAAAAAAATATMGGGDHGSKGMMMQQQQQQQVFRKTPPPGRVTDQRWPSLGSNLSVSPPTYMGFADDLKKLQLGSMREPIIVMQRPQSIKVPSAGSSSPPMGWHLSNMGLARTTANGFLRPAAENGSHPAYQFQQQLTTNGRNTANGLWNNTNHSPTLSAASSLGLFSGIGSTSSAALSSTSPPVDWNSGSSSMVQFDYTNIDWSVDLSSSSSTVLCSRQHQQHNTVGCYGVGKGNVVEAGPGSSSSEPRQQFEFVSSPSL